MSDTSLIFNIIARDSGVGRTLEGIAGKFRGVGKDAEDALERAGSGTNHLDRQLEEAQGRVRALSEEFARTGDRKLFRSIATDRSLIANLERIRSAMRDTRNDSDRLGDGTSRLAGMLGRLTSAAGSLGSGLAGMGGSAISSVGGIGALATAALGLTAALTAAAPAIYLFGGAAAALPGMLAGAAAAVGVLGLGMSGLSENWKAMTTPKVGGGGGGSAPKVDLTPKLRAVEAAQRSVTSTARDVVDAQQAVRDAELDVAKAHETARERLSDLNREYRQAQQDQREAAQGLLEAQQALRLAEWRGNPDEIARARLAVDRQTLAVEEAKDKTEDLGKENTEAARKGVEGSDEVVGARKREQQAQQQLSDSVLAHKLAIQQLGDAQKSLRDKTAAAAAAAAGMGVVLPKIAASAQEFLNKIKALKPAFDDLRLDIQQRLFQGLADKLQVLADRWFPALHTHLGRMADMMNGVVKTAFDSLSDTSFIRNIMTAVDASTSAFGRIGQAIAGPLVGAFGRLARASAPFLEMIGTKLAGIIVQFSDWITKLDNSGALDAFFAKAAHSIGTTFDIMTDLARIAGDLISILFGTKLGGTDAWDNLAIAVHKVADFMGDPEVQAKISTFLNFFGGAIFTIGSFLSVMDQIPANVSSAGDWFAALPARASAALSALPGVVSHWLSAAVNSIGYWVGYGIGWAVRQFINFPVTVARAISSLPSVFAWIGRALTGSVSGLPGQMVAVGRNIVIGIWNGIVSLQSWLWNAAANFAAGILRGVQSALRIGSPSRAMADGVGRWIPLGIAQGMDEHRGSVMEAVARIASDVAGADIQLPSLGQMGEALDAAGGTLKLAASNRQRVEVVSVLDVRGSDGTLKKMIREMSRTGGLSAVGA